MPLNLVNFAKVHKEDLLTSGHRLCPGCAAPMIAKLALFVAENLGYDVVVANATGCLEVSTTIFPFTAWKVPWIHNAFENVAATISGVETAYRVLRRKGRIKPDKEIKFIAFAGDGGTYDIGLQSLSGAVERGHDFLYILYDNEGYMNTGNQRSGSTPPGSYTTTAPVGKKIPGKLQLKKNIVEIMAGHENIYAATAAIGEFMDYMNKVEKALKFKGPSFIAVLSPCIRFWRIPDDSALDITKLAVETKYWPLYEVDRGVYRITKKPRQFKPIKEFIEAQGRFRTLLKHPMASEIIDELQEYVDRRWERLLILEEATKDKPITK
ncbi:MAG: pyruvate ferredoxin oxidoreductase [Thermotogae bacterium]|nr:pyruvate ferredoxin oxidoreductase [Thermotogota bacterium]RKX52987.1 MAG: pyruvate ferredoxin oxidoreductase [Thermotoga sp.]HDM69935.1 pyruvate ferredoxin oxidoreductase [Thermotogales bacterium]